MTDGTGETPRFDLEHDAWGQLVLLDHQGTRYVGVEPVRSFPTSDPDRWVSICDAEGHELVTVEDLGALPPGVREVLELDLARREFVPMIRHILSMPADSEPTEWAVETDRGVTRFTLNSGDDVRRLGAHRVLVIDADGIRYQIGDLQQLDALSRRVLDRYL